MKQIDAGRMSMIAILLASFQLISCQDATNPLTSENRSASVLRATDVTVPLRSDATENGSSGDMPAYYDGKLFTINFKELPPQGEKAVLAHNKSINVIYMSDNGLPNDQPFISVIDAIQGDGFNPLWREVQITFNNGFTPRQLVSDTEIEDAASGAHPEIALTVTDEVYRCSVIGPKK
ncbi:MAG: hypothetical protein HYR76_10070, partial [Ignavibacteria bacterium]|nr:hypothetical protein [Ignavibacteria bacterium]MBI3766496.1 hypothetical protein [Ignavibacteriales bacterium]